MSISYSYVGTDKIEICKSDVCDSSDARYKFREKQKTMFPIELFTWHATIGNISTKLFNDYLDSPEDAFPSTIYVINFDTCRCVKFKRESYYVYCSMIDEQLHKIVITT